MVLVRVFNDPDSILGSAGGPRAQNGIGTLAIRHFTLVDQLKFAALSLDSNPMHVGLPPAAMLS